MKRIAIVGSRRYPRLDLIPALVLGILEPGRHIITGDAAGVDAAITDWVSRLATNPASHHTLEVHRAEWTKHGRSAGIIRNTKIIANADCLIAFWDGKSKGTEETIAAAHARDLPIYIYGPDGRLMPDALSLFGPAEKPFLPDMSGPEYLPLSNPASKAEPATARALA